MPIRILVALLLLSLPSFAAISSTTQWDVRTTGSDTNGGGFDTSSTGTDRSQQDAAFQTYTDLVIDATTNTKVTSAAHAFGATDVGNIINVTSGTGFTVQRVQVVSVTSSVATCDKSLGTLSSTGGNGKLGGALATPDPATSAISNNAASAGNTVHIKAGTYTRTTTLALTAITHIQFVGYGTAHNDNGTRPLITTATNSTPLFFTGGGSYQVFRNISFSNTAGTRSYGLKSNAGGSYNYATAINCIFDGFSWAVIGDNNLASAGYIMLIGTEIKNGTLGGASAWWSIVSINSYIHDNTGPGLQKTGGQNDEQFDVYGSVIARNTKGIDLEASNINFHCINNDIVSNTSDGIFVVSGTTNEYMTLQNNIIYGNTGYGIDWASATAAFDFEMNTHNAWGANTTADTLNYTKNRDGTDITLGSDPFVSKATGNFAIVAGSTLLKAAYPGQSFPGGSVSYGDIGAIQTSGGAGSAFACGFSQLQYPKGDLRDNNQDYRREPCIRRNDSRSF